MVMQQKPIKWNRLDNAAKFFPPTSNKRDTKVFRFACELNEPIHSDTLQCALDKTIKQFPIFQSVLKKGLFWYYLENCDLKPTVKIESNPPCSTIYNKDIKSLLFEVTYYKNRINFEVFHALTDGTGAMQFLRMLVYHYILIQYSSRFEGGHPKFEYDASFAQKTDDSFSKYYLSTEKQKMRKRIAAYQLTGQKTAEDRLKIIEGVISVKSVLNLAHEYGTTLTIFLTAVLMCSINKEMTERDRKRPVVLSIPVNLRNYFPSETARNFFGIMDISYYFKQSNTDLKEVIESLSDSFKRELTAERLGARLNYLASLEHNVFTRITPRSIKDLILKIANHFASGEVTSALSNVGRVNMPQEMIPYIKLFDVFVSTNKLQLCTCSFQDHLTVSFTSSFVNSEVQKNFFRTLTNMGIDITLSANIIDQE